MVIAEVCIIIFILLVPFVVFLILNGNRFRLVGIVSRKRLQYFEVSTIILRTRDWIKSTPSIRLDTEVQGEVHILDTSWVDPALVHSGGG